MSANGNNWYDVMLWVENVIKSCETPLQEISAKKLVKLYLKKYKYEFKELDLSIYYRLMSRLDQIHYSKK
jgi:hypothetical protein